MKRVILAVAIFSLCIVGSTSAFTIKDGEGNKVKVSPLGVKVSTSSGEKVSVTVAGVKVSDGKGAKVNVSPVGVKATDGEGAKVNVSPAGIKVTDGDGAEVDIQATGGQVVTDGEAITKTGVLLVNEYEIVNEARSSAMNFDEIEVSRAIRLIVEERTTGNIIVRAPRSVMPYVSLRVADETLRATMLSGVPVLSRSNVVAEVYVPNNGRIKEINASSAAHVIVKPTIVGHELDLDAMSASVIEVSARCGEVSIDASGASTIKANLSTTDLDIDMSGASVVELSGMAVNAEMDLSGASTLRGKGLQVVNLDLECSGASKAAAVATRCDTRASGASAINVECQQMLNASASGASTIIYGGDCTVNIISNTGASTIRKR